MLSKECLRKSVRQIRQSMTYEAVCEKSSIIENRFLDSVLIKDYQSFLLYSDFDNEVNTEGIISRLRYLNKDVYLPVVSGDTILIYPCTGNMQINRYGILEPLQTGLAVNPRDVDVFVVPGVCFDACGGRIGFGKGYYDKLLVHASDKSIKVGIAFEFQLLESVNCEPHDIRMDYIITEEKTIRVF